MGNLLCVGNTELFSSQFFFEENTTQEMKRIRQTPMVCYNDRKRQIEGEKRKFDLM